MQLTADSQTNHHHRLARENVQHSLTVQARRQNLDKRSRLAINRVGQRENVAARSDKVLGKAAVRFAAYQPAMGAKAGPSGAARMADTAEQTGIGDDALAVADAIVAPFGNDTHGLVAHDARITHRNRAMVDLQIGAADAAMADSD